MDPSFISKWRSISPFRREEKRTKDVDGIRRMLETTFRESKNRGLLYLCMGVCVHSEE